MICGMRHLFRMILGGLAAALLSCAAINAPVVDNRLQQGFDAMYNLSFPAAHQTFETWEREHPQDPRGPVFDAAAYLFSEFDRLRILQSQFFVDDRSFSAKNSLAPDPAVKHHFDDALAKSKSLAEAQLRQAPRDEVALFATVVRLGLQADYDALIEKQNLQALTETKEGRRVAAQLLSLYPDCYDAYLAGGVENYLLSQKSAPVRWLLHATGSETDKEAGIAQLRVTAQKGQYLQPYAELLLAVAALRDKNGAAAKPLLADLAGRFPHNPLYREELQKIP